MPSEKQLLYELRVVQDHFSWWKKSKDEHQPQELVIFPEMEPKVELSHPITKNPYEVTGKANWAAGYDSRSMASDGTVLICVEAKHACTFSHAATQLITHMVMYW